jgi:hypothetical protein
MPGHLDLVPRRVVAWGRSVLASALAAGIAPRAGLALERRRAHAVICDLASVSAACVLALLEAHPDLMVLIVDPDGDRALALTCRRPPMRTIDDLVAALAGGGGGDLDQGAQALDCPEPVPRPPTPSPGSSSREGGRGEDSG